MRIIRSVHDFPAEFREAMVTIGNFDGVHRGHQRIFERVIESAKNVGAPSLAITFEPHPKKVIHPERHPFFLLTPLDEKLALIESCGIDAVLVINFNIEFARTTAGEFVRSILWNALRIKKIFIGYDYTFGKDREGNADFLRDRGAQLGFDIERIEAVFIDNYVVSSTNVRLSILDGNVRLASRMLGRYYNISGTVVQGFRRGTGMGFPTANIQAEKVIPRAGVYVIYAIIDGLRYEGVLNIGFNPTFGNEELSVEGHLFDFQGNIYGKKVTVFFVDRLRDEMKFPSQIGRAHV